MMRTLSCLLAALRQFRLLYAALTHPDLPYVWRDGIRSAALRTHRD